MDAGPEFRALKHFFGYDSFLPHQHEVIRAVLADRDVLTAIATGGGKSLCYQLPALLLPGLTVVISPLIALMKDQVDGLRENGIQAAHLNSTVSYDERRRIEASILEGNLKILYVSPEKMVQRHFLTFLSKVDVSLIAVDEAHCISQWGHEFRPEYRQLQVLKRMFPGVPVIALTATATPQVQRDISEQLHFNDPVISIGSFHRHNLVYEVRPKKQVYGQIVAFLREHRNESGIIYCTSKKTVERIASNLVHDGFRAAAYHAGMPKNRRERVQEQFARDDVRIIVATIAFGMGIDKPDVRFVIHHDLPRNLEHYYQETGRAGRDGIESHCLLFFSRGDQATIRYFIDQMSSETERRVAARKLQEMIDFCECHDCRVRRLLEYFGERTTWEQCGRCDNCRHPKEFFDGSALAQRIIACITEMSGAYGAGYIADVLRGAKMKKIRERGDDTIPSYGKGRDHTKAEWQAYIREMVRTGHLCSEGDRYPVIRLTGKSRMVAAGGEPVLLTRPAHAGRTRAVPRAKGVSPGPLYERLRALRKEIADRDGVPPYLIFPDATLREMAVRRPAGPDELLDVPGVGKRKLARFGEAFLEEVARFSKDEGPAGNAIAPAGGESFRRWEEETVEKTSALYQQGLTIREIARERDLSEETVGAHLEQLILSGAGIRIDDLVLPEKREEIAAAIREYGARDLRSIRKVLGERHSYNEIRLVRAWERTHHG